MENWIVFGQGPLFRFSFVLMLLGLLRVFFLAFVSGGKKHSVSPEKNIEKHNTPFYLFQKEISRIFQVWRRNFFYSLTSTLFHLGLIAVPLFLAAHVTEWRRGVGFSWWALSHETANYLTLLTLVTTFMLLVFKTANIIKGERNAVRNIFWILLLSIPFATGYIAANSEISPAAYQLMMAVHIYSGCLTMVLVPFTGMAECIISPIARIFHALGVFTIAKTVPVFTRHFSGGDEK